MKRVQQLTAVLIVTGSMTFIATAQTPPSPGDQAPGVRAGGEGNTPATATPAHPRYRRRSIVHHYPYPYPEYYNGDQTAGFRDPGGGGRYSEYYPPGDRFQVPDVDPVRVATFGQGGIPDRAEQLAAQQIGIQRYNAIQGHIDRMAAPRLGVGYFGGMY
ncbi:MAG: hypothetical protein ACM3VT_13070 [Solirubrobacterales bacterium]